MTATALLGATAAAAVAAVRSGRRAATPVGFTGVPLTVHATAAGRITLTRTLETLRPGTYALVASHGDPPARAVVGELLDVPAGERTVVRRLIGTPPEEGPRLTPGTHVTVTPQLHHGDPFTALGMWCAFVGWFIASAAAQGYERVIAQPSRTARSEA